jgi:hypothetical protein
MREFAILLIVLMAVILHPPVKWRSYPRSSYRTATSWRYCSAWIDSENGIRSMRNAIVSVAAI